jgi:hypothetical protein
VNMGEHPLVIEGRHDKHYGVFTLQLRVRSRPERRQGASSSTWPAPNEQDTSSREMPREAVTCGRALWARCPFPRVVW